MNLFSAILDLFFPPKCPFCGKLLEKGQDLLCPDCQRDLPWTQGREGERKGEFFTLCVAPLWYRDGVRKSHHRYKFSGVRAYVRTYVILMAQCVADHLEGEFDQITWVPISARRRRKRGYDQAQLLAEGLGRELDMPCRPLLKKVRHTRPQSELDTAAQRRANVLGVYRLCGKRPLLGQRILLVDDVVTTGSTLAECARMLLSVGAEQVVCVTLAMAGEEPCGSNSANLHNLRLKCEEETDIIF